MTEKPKTPCLPKDKAQITQVKGHPFTVRYFTKSSAVCLEKHSWSVSWKKLVYVVKDNDQEAINIVLDTAKIHVDEGHPSVVFYGH